MEVHQPLEQSLWTSSQLLGVMIHRMGDMIISGTVNYFYLHFEEMRGKVLVKDLSEVIVMFSS